MAIPHYLILVALVLILSACSTIQSQKRDTPLVWPSPPDTPRVVYEFTLRNQQSLEQLNRESKLQEIAVASYADSSSVFRKPYDVAAYKGLIAVTDSASGVVHVFDVPRRKWFAIGWRGEGRLLKPIGIDIDQNQQIYVADAGARIVQKFDAQGHFLASIGKPDDFSHISDVAVSKRDGNVYILDRGDVGDLKHRVIVYSPQGEFIRTIGSRGHEKAEFNHPLQIALNENDEIYVLDAGNFRIQVLTANGDFLRAWGRPGNTFGNFARPRGLALSNQELIFVSDAAYQNFQIFNAKGELLMFVGNSGDDQPGQYRLPAGIAVDETNRIYLVDQVFGKVDVFRLLTAEEIKRLSAQ